MTDLRYKIKGKLFTDSDRAFLLVEESGDPCYLAFALPLLGGEQVLFPESLLDDWGHEIRNTALYIWLQENGHDFPRAEVFGYDSAGKNTQAFVREIDLMSDYPCYYFPGRSDQITEGIQVTGFVLPAAGCSSPQVVNGKALFSPPLCNALVQWWQIDPRILDASVNNLFVKMT